MFSYFPLLSCVSLHSFVEGFNLLALCLFAVFSLDALVKCIFGWTQTPRHRNHEGPFLLQRLVHVNWSPLILTFFAVLPIAELGYLSRPRRNSFLQPQSLALNFTYMLVFFVAAAVWLGIKLFSFLRLNRSFVLAFFVFARVRLWKLISNSSDFLHKLVSDTVRFDSSQMALCVWVILQQFSKSFVLFIVR